MAGVSSLVACLLLTLVVVGCAPDLPGGPGAEWRPPPDPERNPAEGWQQEEGCEWQVADYDHYDYVEVYGCTWTLALGSGLTRHRHESYGWSSGSLEVRRVGVSERVLDESGAEIIFDEEGAVRYRLIDALDSTTIAYLEILEDGEVVSVYEAPSGQMAIVERGVSAALPKDLVLVSGVPDPGVERHLEVKEKNKLVWLEEKGVDLEQPTLLHFEVELANRKKVTAAEMLAEIGCTLETDTIHTFARHNFLCWVVPGSDELEAKERAVVEIVTLLGGRYLDWRYWPGCVPETGPDKS
jgi:hypothetical protein